MTKRFLLILVALLWCNVGEAAKKSIEEITKPGADKKFVCKKYVKSIEWSKFNTWALCHYNMQHNYIYFAEKNTEIIWNGKEKVFFIFENVDKPIKCISHSILVLNKCYYGNGILKLFN